jgi:predicted Mrr-cat superfamily restriction endonuclease
MSDIYAIRTHKTREREAAEAWKEQGTCAIGFRKLGNLREARRRLKKTDRHLPKDAEDFLGIRKDDVILAYSKRNTIAYVGRVSDDRYRHNDGNEIGSDRGFGSPNQLGVEWWSDPSHFDRTQLPPWLSEQL